MPRTLTAMFDTRAAAEATRERLIQAGVSSSEIDIQDQSAYSDAAAPQKGGLMEGIRNMFGGHDDHHAYAEGVSRGHVLLSATVKDAQSSEAIQVLEQSDAIDLDARENEWRQSGWTGRSAYAEPAVGIDAYRQPAAAAATAEAVAFRTGYGSPSQFSREYARMFGAPPRRDVVQLRAPLRQEIGERLVSGGGAVPGRGVR